MSKPRSKSVLKHIYIVALVLLIGVIVPISSSMVQAQGSTIAPNQNDSIFMTKQQFDVLKQGSGSVEEKVVKEVVPSAASWPSFVNGNFEQGQYVGWNEYSTHGWNLVRYKSTLPISPHGGNWATWLGGDYNDESYIYQTNLDLSTSSSATLQLWYWIASQDVCGWDYGYVQINLNIVHTWNLCGSKNTNGWSVLNLNLNAYVGQTVNLYIRVYADAYLNSNLFIDDVSLIAGWAGGVNITSDQAVVAVGRPHVGAEVATYSGISSGSLLAYVPMLFRDAFGGSYDSAIYVQNVHTTNTANLTINFYDSNGNLSCTKTDSLTPQASRGYWLPSLTCNSGSLPAGWVGGAVLSSDQPIVVVGRPHIGSQVMTYNGFTSGALTSYVPMLFKDAFGGSYDSALYIQNVHSSNTASLTLHFYDSSGAEVHTMNDTLSSLATKGYWLPAISQLGTSWVGGVLVESDQPIVAVGRPHIGSQITTYNGFSGSEPQLSVPMLFKKAFGGSYNAALYVQNTDNSNAANLTINYYDTNGNLTCSVNDTLPALAIVGYWVPAETCLPDGWVGGAVVVADTNIVALGRPHIGNEVTAYAGFFNGGTQTYLPMLFRDAFGGSYDSALYIQNTNLGAAANVTLQFYNGNGELSCEKTGNIPAGATSGFWLPTLACD